jgi:hypothetical protein
MACKYCNQQKAHWSRLCPKAPKASVLFTDAPPAVLRDLNRSDAINAMIARPATHPLRAGVVVPGYSTLHTFIDGGAGFSCISESLARRLGLIIYPPVGASDIYYAADHLHTRRVGKVHLPLTVHFVDANRETVHFYLMLEVLNIPWDFLLGADVLPALFPGNELVPYGAQPASIASPPTMVTRTPRDDRAIDALLAEDRKTYSELLVGRGAESLQALLATTSSSSSSSSSSAASPPSPPLPSSVPSPDVAPRPPSPTSTAAREQ